MTPLEQLLDIMKRLDEVERKLKEQETKTEKSNQHDNTTQAKSSGSHTATQRN